MSSSRKGGAIALGVFTALVLAGASYTALRATSPQSSHERRTLVEHLANSVEVNEVRDGVCFLSDGSQWQPRAHIGTSAATRALSLAVASGLEVSSGGQAVGLLRIHHWCGNEGIDVHIARVDIDRLIE